MMLSISKSVKHDKLVQWFALLKLDRRAFSHAIARAHHKGILSTAAPAWEHHP
jgi:hypothetical protein